jgi:hypothetical protein
MATFTFVPILKFVADPLDYIYTPPSSTILSGANLLAYSDPIEDQGSLNACSGNAMVSACELILQANSEFTHLSRLFNYYQARKHDDIIGDGGAYLRSNINSAKHDGICREVTWPYDISQFNVTPSDAAYTEAASYVLDRYERIYDGLEWDYSFTPARGYGTPTNGDAAYINSIKHAIDERYPVVIGIPINQKFMDIKGIFDDQYAYPYLGSTFDTPAIAGHAVLIVGYDDAYESFIIENSWGTGWGYNGYGLFPYAVMYECWEAWVIKGFKSVVVPPPAPVPDIVLPSNALVDSVPEVIVDATFLIQGVTIMAVNSSDLVWRKSALVSATIPASNGGTMNFASTVTSNTKNNLFPDIGETERTVGSDTYRKMFLHINKNTLDELMNVQINLNGSTVAGVTTGGSTNAGDFAAFYLGGNADTEDTFTAALPRPYSAYKLTSAVSTGATSIELTPEDFAWASDSANMPIRNGDTLCITDGVNVEYKVVSALTTGTSTFTATIPALLHAYAINSLVASVLPVASVIATVSTPVVTSTLGVFNPDNTLVASDKGTTDESWEILFTSSTAYTVSGTSLGDVGAGSISSDLVLTNVAASAPYLTIKSSGFTGTFAAADTITFDTTSATVPIWVRRIVPAGTSDISNDYLTFNIQAESY